MTHQSSGHVVYAYLNMFRVKDGSLPVFLPGKIKVNNVVKKCFDRHISFHTVFFKSVLCIIFWPKKEKLNKLYNFTVILNFSILTHGGSSLHSTT